MISNEELLQNILLAKILLIPELLSLSHTHNSWIPVVHSDPEDKRKLYFYYTISYTQTDNITAVWRRPSSLTLPPSGLSFLLIMLSKGFYEK